MKAVREPGAFLSQWREANRLVSEAENAYFEAIMEPFASILSPAGASSTSVFSLPFRSVTLEERPLGIALADSVGEHLRRGRVVGQVVAEGDFVPHKAIDRADAGLL